MNFEEIWIMQNKLDESIKINHATHQINNLKSKKILALLVELGEFANEYFPFKYWKKNRNINREKLIEEFVDGIHFLSSMAIELKLENEINFTILSHDENIQLLHVYKQIIKLQRKYNKKQILKVFSLYLGLAKQLEITDEEIAKTYFEKNKINFERIENNY